MHLTKFLLTTLATASFTTASPTPLTPRGTGGRDWDFQGFEKVRGVNIGGWLVLEPWITPSLFDDIDPSLGVIDEYTLGQQLGVDRALPILRQHWDTWCTWADFKWIKDAGFNSVRIPIGYWAYANVGEPYVSGQAVYIDAAIDWARSLNLKVWIDLHGAPGSQNGFDNSGHKTTPGWGQGETIQQTLAVLKTISEKYAKAEFADVVVAVELLNEPLGPVLNMDTVRQFHTDGYYQTRQTSEIPVVMSDAFLDSSQWAGFLTPDTGAQNVIMDHHDYQVFDNYVLALQPWEHRQEVCSRRSSWASTTHWQIIGEWSAAMTDCAYHLNGYGTGARYEAAFSGVEPIYHGSCEGKRHIWQWDEAYKGEVRQYIEAQLDTYEKHSQGWFFWNFKTEGGMGEWDALALVDAGLFPQPLRGRRFGPVCAE